MKLKEKLQNIKNMPFWRTKIITSCTMIYNFLWSVGKILIGIFKFSYIYVMSGCYTFLLGFSKRIFVKNHGKEQRFSKGEWIKINKGTKSMIMGVLILVSGVAFGVYTGSLLFYPRSQSFGLIWSIFLATCSFVEFGIAIYNLFKAQKRQDILLSSLRFCNFVSAIYAIVLTQVALLAAMETENTSLFNASTGIAASIIAIFIGTYIIVRAHKKNKEKEFNNEENSVDTALDAIENQNEVMIGLSKETDIEQYPTTPSIDDVELKD